MRKLLLFTSLLLAPLPMFGAIAATMQWDVRTTGSDSNGGGFDPSVTSPGTDFSQQNAAQIAYTDLVIGGTTTQLTSAAHAFTSAAVGNVINITGGTGFTTGRYEVLSVSGVTATMDRAVGTASSTGGIGNLGGSLLTIQTANTAAALSNTINIKAGTYTFTSSMLVSQISLRFIGYGTTHNDGGTKPLITTSTNSTQLFNGGATDAGVLLFRNLSLSNTATTRAQGIWQSSNHGATEWWIFDSCILDGFTIAIDSSSGAGFTVFYVAVIGTEVKNSTTAGLWGNATGRMAIHGSNFHNNTNPVKGAAVNWVLTNSLFTDNTGAGASIDEAGSPVSQVVTSCTFANNTGNGLTIGSPAASVTNSIFYGNGAYGLQMNGTATNQSAQYLASRSNAYGSNTTAPINYLFSSPGDVTLTANPFTNAGAGDYSLNSTAGGGLLLKGLGYPGIFPGGTSTGHIDIGAVQSGGAATTAGGNFGFSN